MSFEANEIPSSTGEIYDARMNEFCCNYLNNRAATTNCDTLQRPKCSISPINFQQSTANPHSDSGICSTLNIAEYPTINDSYIQPYHQQLPSINHLISPFVPQKTFQLCPEVKHFQNSYLTANCTQNDSALGQSYLEASSCNPNNFLTSSPFFMNHSNIKNNSLPNDEKKPRNKRLTCLLNQPESVKFESTPNKSVFNGTAELSNNNPLTSSIDSVKGQYEPTKPSNTLRARINFHSIIDLAQSSSTDSIHFNDSSSNLSDIKWKPLTQGEINYKAENLQPESFDSNSLCFNEKLKNMISASVENKENVHDFITRVSFVFLE